MKKAIGHPYEELGTWVGLELAVGAGLFTVCTVGFRTTLGLGLSRERLLAAGLAFATIPLGVYWSALAQLAALTAIMTGALVLESRSHEVDRVRTGR